MKIVDALERTGARLKEAGIREYHLESEFLVAGVLGAPRLDLLLRREKALGADQISRLKQWTNERARRKPLAYVVGGQPFMHLNLEVTLDVLIPRPETEGLVERVMSILDALPQTDVVDVGTGSGAIALALASHRAIRQLVAIDRSPQALVVARSNERSLERCRVEWLEGDLLSPVAGRRFDVIVANLPYVKTAEIDALAPELHWEPRIALDGGVDGLVLVRRLMGQAQDHLRPAGWLCLEIGAEQGHDALHFLRNQPGWAQAHCEYDLAGLSRYILAQKVS